MSIRPIENVVPGAYRTSEAARVRCSVMTGAGRPGYVVIPFSIGCDRSIGPFVIARFPESDLTQTMSGGSPPSPFLSPRCRGWRGEWRSGSPLDRGGENGLPGGEPEL